MDKKYIFDGEYYDRDNYSSLSEARKNGAVRKWFTTYGIEQTLVSVLNCGRMSDMLEYGAGDERIMIVWSVNGKKIREMSLAFSANWLTGFLKK